MRNYRDLLLVPLAAISAGLLAACGAARPASTGPTRPAAPVTDSSALASARLAAIAFTDPRRGYGLFVATRDSGNMCQAVVGLTTDGGTRFGRPVPIVSWPCGNTAPWTGLAADSGGDVFLFGPDLFVSHDRGASWHRIRPGGQVLAVASARESVWMLVAHCGGHGQRQVRCPIRLLVSANGGRTFRAAATQIPVATVLGYGSQPVGRADLVRTSAGSGYVLSGPDPNPRGRFNAARLWVTRDGGARWVRRGVRCGLDGLSAALAVAPDGAVFVGCAGQQGAGFQAKSVARSVDGGRTWAGPRSCRPAAALGCPPLNLGYLGQIAATSARTVFLAGDRSALLASQDGGLTWHRVRPAIGDSGGGTFQIGFFGPAGFVLGDDARDNELPAIWHTSDGGSRWRVVHPVIG